MIAVNTKNSHTVNSKELIPWLRENPLRETVEEKRRESEETLEVILEKEKRLRNLLPEELRDFIEIPDAKDLLGDQ